jgi:hypothetical protein
MCFNGSNQKDMRHKNKDNTKFNNKKTNKAHPNKSYKQKRLNKILNVIKSPSLINNSFSIAFKTKNKFQLLKM